MKPVEYHIPGKGFRNGRQKVQQVVVAGGQYGFEIGLTVPGFRQGFCQVRFFLFGAQQCPFLFFQGFDLVPVAGNGCAGQHMVAHQAGQQQSDDQGRRQAFVFPEHLLDARSERHPVGDPQGGIARLIELLKSGPEHGSVHRSESGPIHAGIQTADIALSPRTQVGKFGLKAGNHFGSDPMSGQHDLLDTADGGGQVVDYATDGCFIGGDPFHQRQILEDRRAVRREQHTLEGVGAARDNDLVVAAGRHPDGPCQGALGRIGPAQVQAPGFQPLG